MSREILSSPAQNNPETEKEGRVVEPGLKGRLCRQAPGGPFSESEGPFSIVPNHLNSPSTPQAPAWVRYKAEKVRAAMRREVAYKTRTA